MATYRIMQYPISHFHGLNKFNVPVGSEIINAVPILSRPETVFVLILQPTRDKEEEVEYKEIRVLSVSQGQEFETPEEPLVLDYINTVVWDNGHRLHHLFEVVEAQDNDYDDDDDEEWLEEEWQDTEDYVESKATEAGEDIEKGAETKTE